MVGYPDVATATGQVPVAVLGVAEHVTEVAETKVVACATPLTVITDNAVKLVPVQVKVTAAVPCTLEFGAMLVSVGLLAAPAYEGCEAFGV